MKITDINILPTEEATEKMQEGVNDQNNYFEFEHRLVNGEVRTVEVYSSPHKAEEQDMKK